MKETIFIVGASGLAKEICNLIYTEKLFEIGGFIDRAPTSETLIYNGLNFPIIDEQIFLNTNAYKNACIAIGIGFPELISKISNRFSEYQFPNIVSRHAVIGNDVQMGYGNIVTAGVIMTTSIKIGNHNLFNLNSTIGHDVEIGNTNVINPSVNISGNVRIGNKNLFGVNSVVLQNLSLEDNNILGASALLTKKVTSGKILIGVPAKEKI